jgi:iron complex outermembrane recepter protein
LLRSIYRDIAAAMLFSSSVGCWGAIKIHPQEKTGKTGTDQTGERNMKLGNRVFKAAMLSTISIASIGLASAAHAQDEAPQAEEAADENVIIVTATKREQTLQDVPISVSVTSAETIERAQVRDLIDLQTLVPSLKVGQLQSSANTNFIIRGFGNGANNAGIEPSVGVFIDGVYRSRSASQIGDLANIQRVEVLRGPQSTLFGKNASAGIISVVTKAPQFEFGGGAEVSYGNYDALVVKANVTGPIADSLAFAVEGNYNKRDGYVDVINLNTKSNDRNRWGIRGQLLWEPTDAIKVRLIADYDKIDEVCCAVANVVNGPTGGIINALVGGPAIVANSPYALSTYQNFESSNKIKNYGYSGQVDFDISDSLALTSITAYRSVRSDTNQDSDFTRADLIGNNENHTDIDTFTQELRLASNFDGPLNFLLGGYYFNENIDIEGNLTFGRDFRNYAGALINPTLFGGGVSGSTIVGGLEASLAPFGVTPNSFFLQGQGRFEEYKYKNKAFSIFGQVDFEITDKLTLTGGFNYTDDRKRAATNNTSTDVFSRLDLSQIGWAGALGSFGVNAADPAAVGAFATNNPAIYGAIVNSVRTNCGTAANTTACNPIMALRPLQFLPQFLNYPNSVESGKTHDTDWSYTLRANYKFSNNVSAYATYATGFKATSFNLSTDSRPFPTDFTPGSPVTNPAASPIRTAGLALPNLTSGTRYAGPEDATVYEVGVKGNWQGFGINVAVFKQILKGFQSNVFTGTGFVLGNAEKQSTKGMEIDASITPTRGLNFTASYTYLDPKFDKFTGGSAFNASNNIVPTDLTGETPTGISKHSVSVGGTYNIEVGGGNALILHTDYQLNSAYQIAQGLPYKAAIESLNASIAFALDNGLELSIWGRNLTEPKYNPVIFASVAQSGSLSGYPSPPRFYGASAKFKF